MWKILKICFRRFHVISGRIYAIMSVHAFDFCTYKVSNDLYHSIYVGLLLCFNSLVMSFFTFDVRVTMFGCCLIVVIDSSLP